MDAGIISLAAFAVAAAALVYVLVLGYRATTEIPTPYNLRPELEPKRIMRAGIGLLVLMISLLAGVISGIVWIVTAFTGGA